MHVRRNLKIIGLSSGLVLLVVLSVACAITAVHIQLGITGYVNGASSWSWAQARSAAHYDHYARTGETADFIAAEKALEIPLADRDARLAMEAPVLDMDRARRGFIDGENYPAIVDHMIWLFRYASDFGDFRKAATTWRETDSYLLEQLTIGEALRKEWQSPDPSESDLRELRLRMVATSDRLQQLSWQFRMEMGDAAYSTANLLAIISVIYLTLTALLAWLLGSKLVQELRKSERRFSAIFAQTAVGIANINISGEIIDTNPAIAEILDRSRADLVGTSYRALVFPDDRELASQQYQQIVAGEVESYTIEQRLMKGDGDHVWVRLTMSMVRQKAVAEGYLVAMLEDISESRRLASELSYQATHDSLTGLMNRRAFEYRLARTLNRAHSDQTSHALCFIDLDQFKVINDTSGHVAGDQLLCQVAHAARQVLRKGDVLARLGGDEFGVILENCSLTVAAEIAEKIRRTLEDMVFVWENDHHTLGCSIGVIPITTDSKDINELMRAVDIACYMAKDEGRNRVYVSSGEDRQVAAERGQMEWLNRIQSALQDRRFFLDAQLITPVTKGKSSRGMRYEVLVRLTEKDGSIVPPSAFLPAAERFGIVSRIDRWVIAEVIRRLSENPTHLEALDACHINLSGCSFDQADFTDFVVDHVQRHKLPGHKLCFEITETAAVRNLVDVQAFMTRLASLGCTFALDDFGAGLSSFRYLRQLPVDCLKIDGSFVLDMVTDKTDAAMVKAINDIGQTLGKITIAEYVETPEISALLAQINVDYQQGFGVHRPCRFEKLLKSHTGMAGA